MICMGLGIQRTPPVLVFHFIFRFRFSTTRFDQRLSACMYGHGPPSIVRDHLLVRRSVFIVLLPLLSFFDACMLLFHCVLCS